MVDPGDVTTTEIDGQTVEVEVLHVSLEDQYVADIPQADGFATRFTDLYGDVIRVQPDYEGARFSETEMEQIDDHPDWTIINAGDGEHGPSLTLRYDG